MDKYINTKYVDLNLRIITEFYLEEALIESLYKHVMLTEEIIGEDAVLYDKISSWAQKISKLLMELRDLKLLIVTKKMKILEFQSRFCLSLVIPLSL